MENSYLAARKALGLGREALSNLAKRAGIKVSTVSIQRLETEGEKAIGSRGLGPDTIAYLNYVLGIGSFEPTDWSSVEKGAPVVVAGEKGSFQFITVNDDGSVMVFGRNFRSFDADRVRLVSPTVTPHVASAYLFETRSRGVVNTAVGAHIMAYIMENATQPHNVGTIAYALDLDNALVSRTMGSLAKSGQIVKVHRGVYVLASENTPAEVEDTDTEF